MDYPCIRTRAVDAREIAAICLRRLGPEEEAMTIIRKGAAPVEDNEEQRGMREAHLSDAGGLTQFGAHLVTLQPGARSSDRHWHEAEDEFLYLLMPVRV